MEYDAHEQRIEEAKNRFLKGMTGEIQRAMKDVLKHSDLIKKTGLSDEQIEHVDAIYTNAHRLSWVVNDILDFCRLELGRVDLQSIDFDIEYLIDDVFRNVTGKNQGEPVETYIDIGKDVPRHLVGDPTRLRQVLGNLLSNAFNFTKHGEVGIIVRCLGAPQSSVGDKVPLRITVKDSGEGIAPEDLGAIFDFHAPRDPKRSWEFGGTGLGLSICKLIIESMNGTIVVESDLGKGSEFILTIPFVKGQSHREKGVYPLTKEELVGKKAIIVDDNEIARKILNKCCHTMGIDVVYVSASPKAVLQKLEDLQAEGVTPDLILCDLMMPEMSGYDLARTIRAEDKYKGMKLIAVTSAVRVGGARNAQESGFNGFLPKPVFLDELARVIATVLGGQQEGAAIVTRHMVQELGIKGAKVLVVESGGIDQKLLTDCLGAMDCESEFVPSGYEAVERLKEKIYDLCLLDDEVCRVEGDATVRTIKEIGRNIPVIVLLTTDTKECRNKCRQMGIDDFVVKPIDMVSLKRALVRCAMR